MAIEAREKPARKVKAAGEQLAPKKRGRPRKEQVREAAPGKLEQQRGRPLPQLLQELPRDCDRGSKSNAQGYQHSCEAQRYQERSQAERTNARLKDEFGGKHIWVRGHTKVMSHLMFGLLGLTADQLLRLLT